MEELEWEKNRLFIISTCIKEKRQVSYTTTSPHHIQQLNVIIVRIFINFPSTVITNKKEKNCKFQTY